MYVRGKRDKIQFQLTLIPRPFSGFGQIFVKVLLYLMKSRPAGLVAPADVYEGERGGGEDSIPTLKHDVIFSVVCSPPHWLHLLPDHVGCRSVEHVEGQFCRLERKPSY